MNWVTEKRRENGIENNKSKRETNSKLEKAIMFNVKGIVKV